jgi:DNA polymerase-3 subunit epsilon|tara:strand:+ start:126 stop:809 length:684 start_codon:yes stop_codon:yes gene_type:complete
MNEIFLDTETTGLSPNDGHKIVEIACIETSDLTPTKKIFHKTINPQRDVPEGAYKIHGFSTEFLKDKETFDKVADEFLEFIKDKKIIIHNASFDLGFLNYELKLIRKNEIKKDNIIDSLEVARGKFPGMSNSLDALCRKFGIDLSKRTKHNALLDCELLREVYINLLDAKEPKLFFSNENLKSNSEPALENRISINQDYCKKVVELTSEEIKLHTSFLKKELKKNYY